ncbi:MAG: NIPSNAP family protein [Roseivirga sp.]|nr:NIPSNAP family protein [Roseivirga sp.]
MKYFPILLLALLCACGSANKSEETTTGKKETKEAPAYFELRTYTAAPGKLDELLARFRDHTLDFFEQYDMQGMGYWTPIENDQNQLVYLLGFKDKAQRDASWKAFIADEDWGKIYADSRANGPLVSSIENLFLNYTDYSPHIEKGNKGPRIFSMRTYYTNEGKLDNLHTRFRDHTMEIFNNNGMQNVAYFNLDAGQEGAENTLVYFITFPDTAARTQMWDSFSKDENWKEVYANSIKDGRLVDSLTHVLLEPTDFSAIK